MKKYSRYFKEGVFDSYGLTSELLHIKADEITGRKDDSPRLIFQYACEKMSKEEKARFKRESN